MSSSQDFSAKLDAIRLAMEREEWTKAIQDLENIGELPPKFYAVASNVLFYLYISRNQYEKLARLSSGFDPSKSKDSVSALLLLRDLKLGYSVNLPPSWSVELWEKAIEEHLMAHKLEPKELSLCLHFLSALKRPALLERLLARAVEAGESLDNEAAAIVVRCYLQCRQFAAARHFLWINNLNGIAFERFSFLIDRLEHSTTTVPENDDKFLRFLRYRFGDDTAAINPAPPKAV